MENLKRFFSNPRNLFEKILIKPTFKIQIIVISLLTIISTSLTNNTTSKLINSSIAENKNLSIGEFMGILNSPIIKIIISLLTVYVVIVSVSILYFFIMKIIFKVNCYYKQMISIYSLCYIPIAIGQVFKGIYILLTNNTIQFSNKYITILWGTFDPFTIWRFTLFFLGINIIFSLSRKKSLLITLLLWIIPMLLLCI